MGSVRNGREEGRVLEGKKRIRVMIYGLRDAIRGGKGDEDIETAIVLGGRGEVEAAGAVPHSPTISGVSENRGR